MREYISITAREASLPLQCGSQVLIGMNQVSSPAFPSLLSMIIVDGHLGPGLFFENLLEEPFHVCIYRLCVKHCLFGQFCASHNVKKNM